MTSEQFPATGTPGEAGRTGDLGAAGGPGRTGDPGETPAKTGAPTSGGDRPDDRGRLNLTDPKAIRALAHPLRWALLEALGQAGTLTATQASEMLGESPANCAFHLRTLAKYGFVEEAGGGRGRERPWRHAYDSMSWRTRTDDPQASQAAEALDQVWLDRALTRARHSLMSVGRWPKALDNILGSSTSRLYVTPDEANELYAELQQVFERLAGLHNRFAERKDPKLRPADAVPVEFVLLGYPVLDQPPLPSTDAADDDGTALEADDGTALEADDGTAPEVSAGPG